MWLPLYIGDYMADTMRLTTLEHGAYLLLLMEYWRQGPLADDDNALASITKLDRKTWQKQVGPSIRRFFNANGDGRLHQKRMDFERARTLHINQERSKAAGKRWTKANANAEQKSQPDGVQTIMQMDEQTPPDSRAPASQSQSQRKNPPSLREDPPKRKSQIAPDWWPDQAGLNRAAECGITNVAEEVRKFLDHHQARGSVMADWPAAWRTWCGRGREFRKPSQQWSSGRKGALEAMGLLDEEDPKNE